MSKRGTVVKKILLITSSRYPDSSAMYVRYHSLAKLLQENDYKVTFISRGESTGRRIMEHDGISYFSVRGKSNSVAQRLVDYVFGLRYYVKKFLRKEKYDAVLLFASPNNVLNYLKKYRSKNKIILLHDSVEWYSPQQFRRGKRAREYRRIDYWMTSGISSDFRVVAISKYLEEHFVKRGIRTIRIPVIMDVRKISFDKKCDAQKTTLIYAGSLMEGKII